jgi:hypothetical protein
VSYNPNAGPNRYHHGSCECPKHGGNAPGFREKRSAGPLSCVLCALDDQKNAERAAMIDRIVATHECTIEEYEAHKLIVLSIAAEHGYVRVLIGKGELDLVCARCGERKSEHGGLDGLWCRTVYPAEPMRYASRAPAPTVPESDRCDSTLEATRCSLHHDHVTHLGVDADGKHRAWIGIELAKWNDMQTDNARLRDEIDKYRASVRVAEQRELDAMAELDERADHQRETVDQLSGTWERGREAGRQEAAGVCAELAEQYRDDSTTAEGKNEREFYDDVRNILDRLARSIRGASPAPVDRAKDGA